jgi:diguanylate cyclase (GGDEF)-like protein
MQSSRQGRRSRADLLKVARTPATSGGTPALEALVEAASGILAADSLTGTLGRIAHHLAAVIAYEDLALYGAEMQPLFAVGDLVPDDPIALDAGTVVAIQLIAHDQGVGALHVRRSGAPFTAEEVGIIERFATMAALACDSARQRDVAKTDGLTGLLNHRGSQERLRAALEHAAGDPVSVVVLDLDHFKRVNDRYGHAEGDRVLAAAGRCLRSVVRESDAVGRLGGEEFVLVLPAMEAAEAREVAERARAAVSEVMVGGKPLECSAGVAAYPDDATGAAELLAAADAALYAAKDGGRRQTRRYRAQLARRPLPGEEREEIEALLRTPGSIVPFFQPVLELATGRVSGYEALARMMGGPARPPDEWFAQAHRVGLGPELEAAAVVAAFAAPGRPAGTFLGVNVSPRALISPRLMEALPDDLSSVVVELTEHELFRAGDTLQHRLDELRGRGARIALDDAGSGYAGLQQLIRVAPDILKLDRSLVHGAHADPAKQALLEALISFAASTGSVVCGEGIEELDDLRVLADLDATYAQGYALARPAAGWPELLPETASAVSAQIEHGVRVAAASTGTWSNRLSELADHLARVSDISELASAGRLAAWLLDADDVGVMRIRADDETVDLVSQHDISAVGETWLLSEFPATRHLIETGQVGQVVAGDVHGDPEELAELERMGMGAMLIIPAPLGAAGGAIVEIYRVRPQAFSRAEIDRARVVALQLRAVLSRLAA